ncbi:MAG: hypothetical protein U0796_22760 [Gemmatales bacterium]
MRIAIQLMCFGVLTTILAGCSQTVAAPLPQGNSSVPVAKPTVAPLGDSSTGTIVRIPEGRKQTVPAVTKSAPVQEASDSKPAPATTKSEKKGDKQNGWQGMSRRDRTARNDKETSPKKATLQVSSNTASTEAPSDEGRDDAAATPPAAQAAPSKTTVPPAPVTTAPSTTSTPTATTTMPVTYGTAHQNARQYKKVTNPSNTPTWFTENDKDGDNQLSMNEWPKDRFEEFTKYDRNGDGIITLEEALRTVPKVVAAPATPAATPTATTAPATTTPPAVAATTPTTTPTPVAGTTSTSFTMATPGRPGPGGGAPLSDEDAKRRVDQIYTFVDSNKDGFLDEKEIDNTRSIKNVDWKKYDLNKDGKLDKNEAIALYKAEGNNMRGGMGGGGPGGGGPWAGRSPDEMAKTMFDNIDKNKTGKITKEQMPGFMRDRFAEYDTNKDGFVDFEEFKAGSARMMQGRGGRGGPGGGDGGGRGNRDFGGGGRGGPGGRGGF